MLKWLRPKSTEIIVVSGLPRSGTSLMMQMLEAGGLPILMDNLRPPDSNNPRGYYEYEPARRLYQGNTGWLDQARGHGVKIVSPLLEYLPPDYNYSLIFMNRPLYEVLRSQAVMLEKQHAPSQPDDLQTRYTEHLTSTKTWLTRQPNFRVLQVDYHHVLQQPHSSAAEITAFCRHPLDPEAMAAVVDLRLYRQRTTPHAP